MEEQMEEKKIDLLIKSIITNDLREFIKILGEMENVNEMDSNGDYAIVSASWAANFEMVKRLLVAGADPNIKSKSRSKRNGQTALLLAIPARNEIAKLLLGAGADPNLTDNNGMTPLLKSVMMQDSIDEMLINAGANINIKDKNGETILMKAIRDNRIKLFNKIVSKISNINEKDKTGKYTALDFATIICNKEMVDVLKKYGAKHAKDL